MEKKSNYKYRVGGNQSVSSGIFGLDFSINYDAEESFKAQFDRVIQDLEYAEQRLRQAGYRTAKNIEPKEIKNNKDTKTNDVANKKNGNGDKNKK